MDPITLSAIAIGGAIINALVGAGAVAAPVAAAAIAAGPLATAGTALAGLLGGGAVAGSTAAAGAGAAAVGTNPHASQGVANAWNDATNQAKRDIANAINGLNIPEIPHIVVE